MATDVSYRIQVQISAAPNGDEDTEIYYKRDGTRFESEYTLKFLVETTYEFIITIKPSLPLKSVSVLGSSVTFADHPESGCSKYTFNWTSTKQDANKKKDRTKVPVLLQFQDGVSLVLPLQVKFYKVEDTQHVTWGTPLHQVDYECTIKGGATYVDIVKETFR
ncbi:CB1 cannabinoid receptor-interacting protein 1 [Halotydeus destructor]|nr:CB1 cannabinoid receptor-interacting protein 1 [Halotydeus destructor]